MTFGAKPQMKVTLYRGGTEIGEFRAPWGSQLAATMEDELFEPLEIRIERVDPPVSSAPAIEAPAPKDEDRKDEKKVAAGTGKR